MTETPLVTARLIPSEEAQSLKLVKQRQMSLSSNSGMTLFWVDNPPAVENWALTIVIQFHLSVFEAMMSLAPTDQCSLSRAPQPCAEYEIK